MVTNPSDSAGDMGLIPGSGKSPGVVNGYPLLYSFFFFFFFLGVNSFFLN